MLTKLYRRYIPAKGRQIIYSLFLGWILNFIRNYDKIIQSKKIRIYYLFHTPKNEKEQVYANMGKIGITPYPYFWVKEYDKINIISEWDKERNLPYVIHKGKKLYFRRNTGLAVKDYYRTLLIEQDLRSPHRYVNSYEEMKGKNLLDIGSAEGIFTLDTIEYLNHAYLFECDPEWIEALEATFAPWIDKVTIVRKYVSDIDDNDNVCLDTFFSDKSKDNIFLKMDIEGFERKALNGASDLLRRKDLSGSVCIYHLKDDPEVIEKQLSIANKRTQIVPGYFYIENEMRPSIMRFLDL